MVPESLLVVGSLNMDQIVRVPRLPELGETLLGAGSLRLVPGGKGANQAVAIARLGGRVAMAGRVGNDQFGKQLLATLQASQVQTDLIVTDSKESSGVAFIFLTPHGDNAIVVASGANSQVGHDKDQMVQIIQHLPTTKMLVLQLEIPTETVCELIQEAHKRAIPVVLNLAPAQRLPRTVLSQVSILILNENEAAFLSGQRAETVEDATIVATVLHGYGIATVVITLGAQGAVLVTTDDQQNRIVIHEKAPTVEVVDTTAAGDCFAGALALAFSEGQSPTDALHFAITASALKVTRFGAQSGLPTRQEVNTAFKKDS